MGSNRVLKDLNEIARKVQDEFQEERRVLSFQQYLELFATHPVRFSRDAARYLRDVFDHYGQKKIEKPWGSVTRFSLFDLPWLEDGVAKNEGLVAQEAVQGEVYRALSNFVREGKSNRLPLLHGPNGSAKSTMLRCLMQALEHYSTLEEGALYRFHWVFPNKNVLRGTIGFGEKTSEKRIDEDSYAHLREEQVDARLFVEIRDHPLFLIPVEQRKELLERIHRHSDAKETASDWIVRGCLSHKNRQVFDALLASYDGELQEVLRHVQVERYFISRRYRVGAVTVGPQLSVDAGERQITADRSVGALPSSLKAVALFEAFGELIDASGGILEFSDLLKRPLDAFKYLQHTVETGEVSLTSQSIQVNCVMLASANEVQLEAFREHHEFESFRGRLELVRCPYIRSWLDEKSIYDAQIASHVRRHVAPHATELAAMFAVLTRMRRPNPDRYGKSLSEIIAGLTALEKMDLYSSGLAPSRLDDESAKLLRASISEIYHESDIYGIYEGSIGASPREMRTVLLDAAQSPLYDSLSPFAVLDEIDDLCEKTNEYIWLQEKPVEGGYHDHVRFRKQLRERLLDLLEDEFRVASGLVDDVRYQELFDRYVMQVNYWVKGERVRNPMTGSHDDPDERLMREVEALLMSPDEPEPFRHSLINRVAAWAIDHPGQAVDNAVVFPDQIRRLRDAAFADRRGAVGKLCRDVAILLREEGAGLAKARADEARKVVERLCQRYAYAPSSVADAAAALVRERFSDVLN